MNTLAIVCAIMAHAFYSKDRSGYPWLIMLIIANLAAVLSVK